MVVICSREWYIITSSKSYGGGKFCRVEAISSAIASGVLRTVLLHLQQVESDIWPITSKLNFTPSHKDKNKLNDDLIPETQLNNKCADLCNEQLDELEMKSRR
jgi:hypothetical protein